LKWRSRRADRIAFERDALFPLAGLDPSACRNTTTWLKLVDQLSYAGNEAARRYIDGSIDRAGAAAWLEKYAMYTKPRAEQRVKFIDQYRSYVINYNLGKDLIRDYIVKKSGRQAAASRAVARVRGVVSSPRLPSGLK